MPHTAPVTQYGSLASARGACQQRDVRIRAGAFYVMDRGYLDFERLYRLHQAASFFVTRAKSNFKFKRVYSRRVDRSTGLLCDQEVQLVVFYSQQAYRERLRRIR